MTLETMIVARTGDIGGFEVRRALPSVKRRMVGPFVFLDQMGPAEFLIGARAGCAGPIRISDWLPSPTCSRVKSCTATALARCSRSALARSTG